jgi:hypothetical protein
MPAPTWNEREIVAQIEQGQLWKAADILRELFEEICSMQSLAKSDHRSSVIHAGMQLDALNKAEMFVTRFASALGLADLLGLEEWDENGGRG